MDVEKREITMQNVPAGYAWRGREMKCSTLDSSHLPVRYPSGDVKWVVRCEHGSQ